MAQEENVTPINAKQVKTETRQRSTIQFPYSDLDDAVKLASAIYENAGMGDCDGAQLAAWTGQSAKSSSFRLQLTGSKMFNIIDSISGRYKLTELGKKIVDPKQKKSAKAEAFLNVELYRAVFDKYNGSQLPPAAGLENDLVTLGVSDKVKDRARQVMERSAQYAGFFEHGKGRMVMPSVQKVDEDEESQDTGDEDAADSAEGKYSVTKRDFHPFIEGLLEELPQKGESWSEEDQTQWLNTAKHIFGMIYKNGKKSAVSKTEDDVLA